MLKLRSQRGGRERLHAGAEPLEIDIDGVPVGVRVRPDSRAKRYILRLGSDGTPVLTVPMGAQRGAAERVLERHTGWLAARLAKLPQRVEFIDGAVLPLRGVSHRIVYQCGRGRPVAVTDDGDEPLLDVRAPSPDIARRVLTFLQREARQDVEEASLQAAQRAGASYSRIRIGDPKSRWGSCSSTGTLSYSWRLILAPPHVLQYLAAHEVAHLKELNHGPQFWKLCRSLADDIDGAQSWLKLHGRELQRYG